MPTINNNGVNIYYFQAGHGVPVVFLHAWHANHYIWYHQIFTFSENYRVIAPDLRGTGASDKPKHGYAIADYAGDIAAILDAEKIDRAVLVGNSIGGLIALQFNLDHPDRVIGNVIISTPLTASRKNLDAVDPNWAQAFEKDFYGESGKLVPETLSARTLRERPEILATNRAWFSARNFPEHVFWAATSEPGTLFDWGGQGRLSEIDKPTIYFAGSEDMRVPISEGEFLCSRMPNCELRVRQNISHHYQIESPSEFNKELEGILTKLAGAPVNS